MISFVKIVISLNKYLFYSIAEEKKTEGNRLYMLKQYEEALPYYTEAISLQPKNASYYGNRSACYIMLSKFRNALEDARKAVSIDPTFVKGYVRMAKCFLVFGDITAAVSSISKAKELCPNSEIAENESKIVERVKYFKEDADNAYESKNYRRVVFCVDCMQAFGVNCTSYKLRKAECLALLGKYYEARVIAK